jgi:hypothetical protein
MLTMPTRHGWTVEWETGEVRVMKYKNCDYSREIKLKDSFESTSRTEVEAKQREMKEKGYKVSEIMQCIF